MSVDTYLMQIGWDVIRNFINDWREEPLRWGYEIEIQAEIYGRLSKVYDLLGEGIFQGNYENYGCEQLKNAQILNRVSCETKDRTDRKMPDLIIWEDADFHNYTMEKDWPMLFVCEIKVTNRFVSEAKRIQDDEEKVKNILLRKRSKYGCLLVFCFKKEGQFECPPMLSKGECKRIDIPISSKVGMP